MLSSNVFLTASCTAHYEAATNDVAPVLHRDISGGNILILPKGVDGAGTRELVWTGLLCDWEMAKSTVRGDLTMPRQPERTVSILTRQL